MQYINEVYTEYGENKNNLIVLSFHAYGEEENTINFEEDNGVLYPSVCSDSGGYEQDNNYTIEWHPKIIVIEPDRTVHNQDLFWSDFRMPDLMDSLATLNIEKSGESVTANPVSKMARNLIQVDSKKLSISFFQDDLYKIELFNVTGRSLLKTKQNYKAGDSFVHSLDKMGQGVYLVECRGKKSLGTTKFVIHR